jgi:hypothetical protein
MHLGFHLVLTGFAMGFDHHTVCATSAGLFWFPL